MKRKLISMLLAAALVSGTAALAAEKPAVGDSLITGDYLASAEETQSLIDSQPRTGRAMEDIDRGLIAVKVDKYVYLSWRWLGYESVNTRYNIYRNGEKLNEEPLPLTNYTDISIPSSDIASASYSVAPVTEGTEGEQCDAVSVWNDNYTDIPIQKPDDNEINGEAYSYSAGDASVADLDGDGQYEIILKWNPSNSKDAANSGFTGECIIDAYDTDGTLMWRVNMGPNIRAGEHDTQFMVYDFDGDGAAEMICRTADGTMAGDGTYIGDADANWADPESGKNLTGPLYLTAFRGTDGTVIDTVDYEPQTVSDKGGVDTWGDTWGNRSERYLAGIGSLDGKTTSAVFARGYYTGSEGETGGRTVIAAWDLVDGSLEKRWVFDTMDYENQYIGQGNHSMSMADADFDGCDEVIYGALAVDHDGTPMYSTGLGHGDAQHVGDILPSRPGLEVFSCHEDTNAEYSFDLRDARTGEILWGGDQLGIDNGRAAAADIDPRYEGEECWSAAGVLTTADGTVISDDYTMSANFMVYWDGDLGREVQDGIYISKWNSMYQTTDTIFTASGCSAVNGTKANPSLTADILGDWREEVIYPLNDNSALRIYTTNIPTAYRLPTLMHDTQYRNHVALQNTCYNQPTHLSYYLGYDTETVPVPDITVNGVSNPDTEPYILKSSNAEEDDRLITIGNRLYLVEGYPVALANGMPKRIDNDNLDVVPYLIDGAQSHEDNIVWVPLRFIAEFAGATVEWDGMNNAVTLIFPRGEILILRIGSTTATSGTFGGKTAVSPDSGVVNIIENSSDFELRCDAPVVIDGRTMVPTDLLIYFDLVGGNSLSGGYHSTGGYGPQPGGLISTMETYSNTAGNRYSDEIIEAILNAEVPSQIIPVALGGDNEKFYDNQLDVFEVTATSNDGNNEAGAVDRDMGTRWSAYGPNNLTLDLGSEQEVTGVAIAMWKGSERIYPFIIQYSTDGSNWETALEKTQNSGTTEDFEVYEFEAPVTARYIRYAGDGATDPEKNYCHISEIAVLGIEK